MTDRLASYRAKRHFAHTPEPDGAEPAAPEQRGVFVVQRHEARRLHFDFRLELGGVLKSWAVPKGPSTDPADRRMAVEVEDHPLAYARFEGTIPPGHYGAGTVQIWDSGTWEPIGDPHAGYRAGKLRFVLHGRALRGAWTLVRMRGHEGDRQQPWLLLKERERTADTACAVDTARAPATAGEDRKVPRRPSNLPRTLPRTLSPALATLVTAAPAGDDWLYEMKFDGYRILAHVEGGRARLLTRQGLDWTRRMPDLARDLARPELDGSWLDGEIILPDADGVADFQALQSAFDSARTGDIVYCVFDLPFHQHRDWRAQPLHARRDALRQLVAKCAFTAVRFSEDFAAEPQALLHAACALRVEGVMGKRRDSPYPQGRSADWIKLKCTQRQEFVIAGYTEPKGGRTGLGALVLGVHDEAGGLRHVGQVGSGFSEQALRSLHARLTDLHATEMPFVAKPKGLKAQWVVPRLVAEVSFAAWTREGHLRQAVFHGVRDDKPASQIQRETAQPPGGLRVSHPERLVDAASGLTKQALVDYAVLASRRWMPHLAGRPVALVRAPDGLAGELFFQKHATGAGMKGLTRLPAALDPGHAPLLAVDDPGALLAAMQANVLELHTWNARVGDIDRPDRMTFDLDPGEGVAWAQVQEGAQLVQALLLELRLRSFLKTSGGKGLHVVVPLAPDAGWDEVKALSHAVVRHLAATLPDRFVSKSGPRNRIGRIFVDYLRNGRGATTVSAWSPRARPGMGVSVPVDWSELPDLTGGAHWTVQTVAPRLQGPDPWAGMTRLRQRLHALRKAFG